MAQYYHVLSQVEKPTTMEEIRRFYPNIVENQPVQYVISPDDQQQQFEGQQILVSADQLMVIENQGPPVIVDPSTVTYTNPQYVVQEEFPRNRQQPVYYMEQPEKDREPQGGEQPVQPVILNHQLHDAQIRNQLLSQKSTAPLQTQHVTTAPTRHVQPQARAVPAAGRAPVQQVRPPQTIPQPVIQERTPPQTHLQSRPPVVQANTARSAQPKVRNKTPPASPRNATPQRRIPEVPPLLYNMQHEGCKPAQIGESDKQEAVSLQDGSIVSLAEFKRMLNERNQNSSARVDHRSTAIQDRLEAPPIVPPDPASKRKYSRAPANPRGARSLGRSVGRGNSRAKPTIPSPDHPSYTVQINTNPTSQPQRYTPQPLQLKLLSERPGVHQPAILQQKQPALQQHKPQPTLQQHKQQPTMQQHKQQPALQQHKQPGLQQQPPKQMGLPSNAFLLQQQLLQQQLALKQQIAMKQQQQQQQAVLAKPQQPQFIIQPPSHNQQQQHCPLPSYIPSSQIQQIIESTPVGEEYSDSIRMLVLLENGEQRLITFTLPKELCTIQEILEQVAVPFHPETKIECTETNSNGINYVVTVGVHQHAEHALMDCEEAIIPKEEIKEEEETPVSSQEQQINCIVGADGVLSEPLSPEPPKEIPRYVSGRLAVCTHCGYLSEDFNKCLRCRTKLSDDVKSIPASTNGAAKGKNADFIAKTMQAINDAKLAIKTNLPPKTCNITLKKKPKTKVVDAEPVLISLSSDDEDEQTKNAKSSLATLQSTELLIQKLAESAVTLSAIKKEPSTTEIQQNLVETQHSQSARGGGKEEVNNVPELSTAITCRTIRIGSYRYIPLEDLVINSSGIILKVPLPKDPREIKTIVIEHHKMVKVLANFQKVMPVMFYYVTPSAGEAVREVLNMTEGSDLYFDPCSREESHRRITILPESITEDCKSRFKRIYGKPVNIMDELTSKEANDILIKTCPKEVTKMIANSGYTEIKQLLIYPPGKGGLPINTEDYLCLAQDQFLNDVIIDFYLKFLVLNLPCSQQNKVHVFSTFFYKRLTTKPLKASRKSHPAELDPTLSASEKRHARVEKWTKNVNLFEKDYVVIPINENCHWFLAIVCFPGMTGCFTMDGKHIVDEPIRKRKKNTTTILGGLTITQIKLEKGANIPCDDLELSDKDEAEGDDSELESCDDSDVPEPPEPAVVITPTNPKNRQPIKQPCILIFDSLAGASRSRVVATLRDYLTCEFKAKMGTERIFNKDVIKGACPKVPQQTNFTDCGLYLLQYVEQFFKDPIQDYHIPIKQLKDWFDEFVVTRKREDISLLIKGLMIKYDRDPSALPDVIFPTLNGKLVVQSHDEDEEMFEDDEEDLPDDEEEEDSSEYHTDHMNDTITEATHPDTFKSQSEVLNSPNRTSGSNSSDSAYQNERLLQVKANEKIRTNDGFVEQTVPNAAALKPDCSETPPTASNRDTMSYLKAKRIIRHKSSEPVDSKKFKFAE